MKLLHDKTYPNSHENEIKKYFSKAFQGCNNPTGHKTKSTRKEVCEKKLTEDISLVFHAHANRIPHSEGVTKSAPSVMPKHCHNVPKSIHPKSQSNQSLLSASSSESLLLSKESSSSSSSSPYSASSSCCLRSCSSSSPRKRFSNEANASTSLTGQKEKRGYTALSCVSSITL